MSKKQEYEAKQKQKEQDRRPLTLSERVQPRSMELLAKLHILINEYPDCISDITTRSGIGVSFYPTASFVRQHPEISKYVTEHPELTSKPEPQKDLLSLINPRKK